jgi:hypothetical protein
MVLYLTMQLISKATNFHDSEGNLHRTAVRYTTEGAKERGLSGSHLCIRIVASDGHTANEPWWQQQIHTGEFHTVSAALAADLERDLQAFSPTTR